MKVIFNAKKSEYPYNAICEHCNSIVQIESAGDIKQVEISAYDPRDGDKYSYKVDGYKCPVCSKETELKKHNEN